MTDGCESIAKLPWMRWSVGERVVVRYRLADGLHDALGYLTQVTPDAVTVATRHRGSVRVEAHTMVTGKRVPPSPFDPPPSCPGEITPGS